MYRDRWRVLGVLVSVSILFVGMAETNQWEPSNLYYVLGALLAPVIGGIIGQLVYRKRSPW